MNRLRKTLFIGIISFSIILTSIIFVLLINEDNTKSDSDKEDSDIQSVPIEQDYYAKGIRLTFIHNFNESVVISWFTELNVTDPLVNYSTKADLSNSIVIKANSTEISSTFIHIAELVDLLPNTTYFYQISSDKYHKREILTFTTMANNPNHIRFLVYGDSRTNRTARMNLAEKIMENFKDNFQFTIHDGDIVNDGREQSLWNNYFIDTESLNSYKQGIYVEGNHEWGQVIDIKMYDNLPMRNNYSLSNRYYSFSYMGIGFIILNSNDYTAGDYVQTEWLNQTLIQFSQENVFNLAFLHHPLLHVRSNPYHRDNWNPLFEKYNVSIIFCGHNHNYERSYPITNSTFNSIEYDNSELYNYTNLYDPIYIVTGGAGAPLYPCYDYEFIAKTESAYNFLLIDVKEEGTKTTLSLETWCIPQNFGSLYLFDNVTISK
ncbi:MAG: purple acid phosphatase family protein [Promethearchaeota archaeon]